MKDNLRVNIQNELGNSNVSILDSTRRDPKPVLPGKQKTYVLSPSGPVSDLILIVEGRSAGSYRIGVPTGIEIAPFEDDGGGTALPPNSSSWKLSIKESGPFDTTDGNATDKNVTIGENEPVRQY
jgi:hypothetical protein